MLFSAFGAATFYHDPNVGRVGSGRAGRLAVDDVVVYMRYLHLGY